MHQYGCRVIQKLLYLSDGEEKTKLKKEIYKNLSDLSQDQYGNYVIQHLLEINKGKDCEEIFRFTKGKVYEMSTHKYASNIIERCLYFGSKEKRYSIIDEVLSKDDYLHDSLISLVKDKFGNYVVQKMIENSEEDKKNEIIKRILNSYLVKRKEGYTKHVLNYIDQLGYNTNINNFNKQMNVNNNNTNINEINSLNEDKNKD
jgi:pumilio RNA-binding family